MTENILISWDPDPPLDCKYSLVVRVILVRVDRQRVGLGVKNPLVETDLLLVNISKE